MSDFDVSDAELDYRATMRRAQIRKSRAKWALSCSDMTCGASDCLRCHPEGEKEDDDDVE